MMFDEKQKVLTDSESKAIATAAIHLDTLRQRLWAIERTRRSGCIGREAARLVQEAQSLLDELVASAMAKADKP